MATILNRQVTFSTNGTVTAAGLHNLIDETEIYAGIITTQPVISSVGSSDQLLIADADLTPTSAPRRVTVGSMFNDALNNGVYTSSSFTGTLTAGSFVGPLNGNVTGTIVGTGGTVSSLTTGTTTSTAANITNGTVQTLTASTASISQGSAILTQGTIATLNSTAATITTGTIPTLVATTLVTTGTGTAAAPAIVPTGDTNTGIFFPAADTIAFAEGGAEGMRINSSGNVGIGITNPSVNLEVAGTTGIRTRYDTSGAGLLINQTSSAGDAFIINQANAGLALATNNTERLRITSSGDVYVAAGKQIQITGSPGTTGLQLFGQDAAESLIGTMSSQALVFRTYATERLRIDSSGDCLVTSNARLGYGAGSGGTVTQGTSKTTGVTLNKPTGQITMHNANLANAATVRFTLTNSFISAVDILAVNATAFAGYTTTCENTATGAATIRVTNVSGGGLAEAVTLQFVVIKGSAT